MVAAAWFMTWYESDESRGPGSGSGEVEFAAEEA